MRKERRQGRIRHRCRYRVIQFNGNLGFVQVRGEEYAWKGSGNKIGRRH